jgi:hypothetical protein
VDIGGTEMTIRGVIFDRIWRRFTPDRRSDMVRAGRVSSLPQVPYVHRDQAEAAITAKRYDVYLGRLDCEPVLILHTEPRLVAIVKRGFPDVGGDADMIIHALHEPEGDPRDFADNLADFV